MFEQVRASGNLTDPDVGGLLKYMLKCNPIHHKNISRTCTDLNGCDNWNESLVLSVCLFAYWSVCLSVHLLGNLHLRLYIYLFVKPKCHSDMTQNFQPDRKSSSLIILASEVERYFNVQLRKAFPLSRDCLRCFFFVYLSLNPPPLLIYILYNRKLWNKPFSLVPKIHWQSESNYCDNRNHTERDPVAPQNRTDAAKTAQFLKSCWVQGRLRPPLRSIVIRFAC